MIGGHRVRVRQLKARERELEQRERARAGDAGRGFAIIADSMKLLADKIRSFDGFVFVTAEYNHSIPGALKNAIDFLRGLQPDADQPYYLYVVDEENRLTGVVGLRPLIMARPDQTLGEIMNTEVISVAADMDQEEVAGVLAHYDVLALPVVDKDNRLLGIVTIDDVMDVLEEAVRERGMRRVGLSVSLDPEAAPARAGLEKVLKAAVAAGPPREPTHHAVELLPEIVHGPQLLSGGHTALPGDITTRQPCLAEQVVEVFGAAVNELGSELDRH